MLYNIVYCTDDNYCMPTVVSIVSLITNQSQLLDKQDEYCIHVICDGVSEINLQKIKQITLPKSFKLSVVDADSARKFLPENELHLTNSVKHVSRTAFIKFVLCRVLPELDQVLYLDCDTLVLGDIRKIFRESAPNFAAVVVKDYPLKIRARNFAYLNVDKDSYFNSGVMLLNLSYIRQYSLDRKLLAYRIVGNNKFQDQDAFNVVFNGLVKYIGPYCNYLQVYDLEYTVYHLIYLFGFDVPDDLHERMKLITILHLSGPNKPWQQQTVFTDLFTQYYLLSPYSDEKLLIKSMTASLVEDEVTYLNSFSRIRNWIVKNLFPTRSYFDYRLSHLEKNQRQLARQVVELRELLLHYIHTNSGRHK